MTNWDSASFKLNRAGDENTVARSLSSAPYSASGEPDVEGKWHPRTTLVFIIVSCALLWGAILATAYELL